MMPIPSLVLELVAGYLDTPELYQCCLVSKEFYRPAAAHLYRLIILTEGNKSLDIRKEINCRKSNKASTIDMLEDGRLDTFLLEVCLKRRLASKIKSLTLSPAEDLEDDEWILFLLEVTLLNSFHYKGLAKFSPEKSQPIQSLSLFLSSLANSKPFTQLTELTIFYKGQEEDRKLFTQIASQMIKLNTYRILRKLRFERSNTTSFRYVPWLEEDVESPEVPEWVSFFGAFAGKGLKLDLNYLGLDRNFYGDCLKVAAIIQKAVDLGNLDTLSVQFEEGDESEEDGTTIFECLCKHTPLLKGLIIKQTDMYDSFLDSVARTLREHIPNQLTKLWLYLDRDDELDPEPLRQVILSYQHNLVQLRLQDGEYVEQAGIVPPLMQTFNRFFLTEHYCELSTRESTLQARGPNEPIPYVSVEKVKLLQNHKKEILKMLKLNSIYNEAAEKLPFLTKCYLQRFWVNVKTRSLICHEEDIPLE